MSSFSFIFPLGKIHPSLPAIQRKNFILAINFNFLTLISFLPTAILLYICLLSHCDTEENCEIPF